MKCAIHISLGVVLALVLMAGSAAAERVWTKTAASLHAEPSQESRQVGRIAANRSLTVVGKQGRWLKVKKGAKSGWILRAQIRAARQGGSRGDTADARGAADRDDGEPTASDASASGAGGAQVQASDAASPRESSADAGGSSRPCPKNAVWCGPDREGDAILVVVIPDSVNAYREPGENQDLAFVAAKDQELVVIGYHRPSWFYVQTMDGKFGWIAKAAVRQKGGLADSRVDSLPEIDPKTVDTVVARKARQPEGKSGSGEPGPAEPGRLRISASAGLGVALMGRSFTATNRDQSNYEASSTGIATLLAADARYRMRGVWHVGLDGTYVVAAGAPGLSYTPAGGAERDIGGFILHRFETSGKLGYAGGFDAFLRAGFLVETFYLNDLFNDGFLPRERLLSPTVGVELGKEDIVAGLGLALRADLLLGGSLAQTRGREDGSFDSLSALSAQFDASYPLGRRLAIRGIYRFDLVGPSWTGASTRAPGVNGASRTDQAHRLLLGLGMRF